MWLHTIAIQPFVSDALCVLFSSYISLSLPSTIQIAHVLKYKDEEDLLLEQLDGTKPVEEKDRVNDYETCESEEWLQLNAPKGKPHVYSAWQNTYKKRTAKFSTNHKKTANNFNFFLWPFDDFFLLLYKLSERRIL